MSSQRRASTMADSDSRGARGDQSARTRRSTRGVRAAWPPRPDRSPVGGVALDADQARVVMGLLLVALALVCVAQAVARMGLRAPRIVPLSAAGRAEAVSLLASLIAGVA